MNATVNDNDNDKDDVRMFGRANIFDVLCSECQETLYPDTLMIKVKTVNDEESCVTC